MRIHDKKSFLAEKGSQTPGCWQFSYDSLAHIIIQRKPSASCSRVIKAKAAQKQHPAHACILCHHTYYSLGQLFPQSKIFQPPPNETLPLGYGPTPPNSQPIVQPNRPNMYRWQCPFTNRIDSRLWCDTAYLLLTQPNNLIRLKLPVPRPETQ